MRAKHVSKVTTFEEIEELDKKRRAVEKKKESEFNKIYKEIYDEINDIVKIESNLESVCNYAKEIFVYTNWRGTPLKRAVIISTAVALSFVDRYYSMMLLRKHRVPARDMNKLGKVEAFPYVDYIADKVDEKVNCIAKDLAVRTAKRIISKYKKGSPIIVAASAFYLVAKIVCKGVTQKLVSDIANITDVPIRYTIKEMKDILRELIEDAE